MEGRRGGGKEGKGEMHGNMGDGGIVSCINS